MSTDATDTPSDEIQSDTSFDGIGASATEGVEEQFQSEQEEVDYSENPLAYFDTRDDIPDDVKQAVQRGFLRQSDYTRKTQAVATERRRLDDQRSVVDQIILDKSDARKQAEKVPEEPPPDLANGAKPEDIIVYYVNKQVEEKLAALGVNDKLENLAPMAQQQKVVASYQKFASANPGLDHSKLAGDVGHILDTDPDLADLAEINPDRAVRLAARVAQSGRKSAKTTAKSKKRKKAAPVATRQGSVVRKGRRESPLEAATRALKEQGSTFGN